MTLDLTWGRSPVKITGGKSLGEITWGSSPWGKSPASAHIHWQRQI